ncbi:hypothetical protein DFH29DRAFT_882105 [Suillus ampliporus]|nr:hypothetical protein DFH29DRAFT_882576 [Suillus ampliporus]KAG0692365.1 hypothetical protein DFH29DRAFT_882578 [Suillus ampliporus]KAG0692367.1 hypothetical protein DFH29DRAFT_882580 [Suillus ampliporus]KAG0692369.1 hypothetical protein DFH29DRAFT_882582 [Suillus ampliporus]KAG0692748.1 hypothetical protein DFH29DRAFT_882105 [Suillus ampliporus]
MQYLCADAATAQIDHQGSTQDKDQEYNTMRYTTKDHDEFEDKDKASKIKRHQSHKIAKIKQNQSKSERDFDLDIKHPNSTKIAKIKQNQAKSERGFDLSPRINPDEDKDKQYDKKDYDSKNQ